MPENLKSKVVKGAFWNGLERFGIAFFLFVSNLVLARLLSPEDFGCIGMLMVFISISDAIVDGGFGAALVQKKNVSQEDYSTIFVWNIFVSVFLYVLLFICAPTIASFYNIDSLALILRVQGLVLLFNALCIIQQSMLQKNLMFKKLAKVNVSATIVGTVIGIICAFIGYGVWSLVVKLLFTSVMASVVLWVGTNWKPKIMFDYASFKSLFCFGSFIFMSSITNSIFSNTISLVIGKSVSPAALGYFTQGRKLEDIPRQTISSVVRNVSFPTLSTIQDDNFKILDSVRKTNRLLSYINFSLTILMMVEARPLVLLLFSEKWEKSIPYFQVISMFGLVYSITELYNSVLQAQGKSQLLFVTNLIYRVSGILLMLLGTLWGIWGILFAYITCFYLGFILFSFVISKSAKYSISAQLEDMIPSFSIAIISGVMTWGLHHLLMSSDLFFSLVIECSTFIIITLLFSQLFKLKPYKYILHIIRKEV